MVYRYYSTQRPVQIGGYPASENVTLIHNFEDPKYCEEIGRPAWGYIEYDRLLSEKEIKNYELVYENATHIYEVCIMRYGYATVNAKNREGARTMASKMKAEEINWEDIRPYDIEVFEKED